MPWFNALLAVFAGVCVAVQAAVNTRLRSQLESPLIAGMFNFVIGAATMLVVVAVARSPWPSGEAVRGTPWWAWVGGTLGATLVTLSIMVAPRIGTAGLVAGLVAGQVVASLAIDHLGVLGMPERPLTWSKAGGAALVVVGTLLVIKGKA